MKSKTKHGAKSSIVQQTVHALEKTQRKTHQALFGDLARRVSQPARQRTRINLWKCGFAYVRNFHGL